MLCLDKMTETFYEPFDLNFATDDDCLEFVCNQCNEDSWGSMNTNHSAYKQHICYDCENESYSHRLIKNKREMIKNEQL